MRLSSEEFGILKYLDDVSQKDYGTRFTPPANKEIAFDERLNQIQIDHISDLSHLVELEGKVYFADHFSARRKFKYI